MMSNYNITNQYSWNNHKEMDKYKLFEIYQKLNLEEQKIVYEYLIPARQKLLNEQIASNRKRQSKEEDQANINYILKILGAYIDEKSLKSPLEAALFFSILQHHDFLDLYGEKNKYYSREKDEFDKTKEKMLSWIQKLSQRETHTPPSEAAMEKIDYWRTECDKLNMPIYFISDDLTPKEALYNALEKLEFVPIHTKDDLIGNKRALFQNIFENAGISKTPAMAMTKNLIDYIKYVHVETDQGIEIQSQELEKLLTLLKNSDLTPSQIREELMLMLKKDLLEIGVESDNFTSIGLKTSALKYLLSDDFIEYGEELLKVYSPVESYPLTFDPWSSNLEEYIYHERKLFQKYGKILTQQHIDKIMTLCNILDSQPNSLEGLAEEEAEFTLSQYP